MCGLKLRFVLNRAAPRAVTPFVGVWIETLCMCPGCEVDEVTPFVGVWIETEMPAQYFQNLGVTPFVGVWIETF